MLDGLAAMLVPINFLRPDPGNPRTQVNLEALLTSIRAFGVRWPIVVNRRTGVIEAGHQRADALRRLGAQHVPVLWADDDGATARAFMVADNRVGEVVADWDDEGLRLVLEDLGRQSEELLGALGFDDGDLARLLAGEDDPPGGDDGTEALQSKADVLQGRWGTAPGQLWRLGDHRLLCGDATKAKDVARLMGGDLAELVVTDPPYGVAYADKNTFLNAISPGNRIQVPIDGDHADKEQTQEFWRAAFAEMSAVMAPGAVVYCFMPQGGDQMMMMMMMMMMGAGIEPRHELIWVKNNHVLGRTDYAYKHEPILYAWKEGGHKFYGDFQTSILEFARPQKSDLHPTTKPVELIERLVANSSITEGIVYDPFVGSGTTLIACEHLGRRCRAMEVSPAYAAVVLERWSLATSSVPEQIDD